MTFLHPKKLLLSKWTAIKPVGKQKHFLVTRVINPEVEGGKIEWVELEAIMTKKTRKIGWRELQDTQVWPQGWIRYIRLRAIPRTSTRIPRIQSR